MTKLLGLGLAGAFGTLARYGLCVLIGRWCAAGGFPWGTFAVNILGCFGFGFLWSVAAGRTDLPTDLQLVVLTGFFGAFTTFSTLQHETGQLLDNARWTTAMVNLAAQNLLGVVMLLAGVRLGRLP
ncbi:MAG: fluoride efflux transporter CrcB [Planctomycetes bacterium]|nr:fluoride efflux transporter CrcB [Planctomycetota bacterium]